MEIHHVWAVRAETRSGAGGEGSTPVLSLLEIALWRSLILEETEQYTSERRFVVNCDAVKISGKKQAG